MDRASAERAKAVAESAREQEWTNPSFAKDLPLGSQRLDPIHPFPQPRPKDVQKGEAFGK